MAKTKKRVVRRRKLPGEIVGEMNGFPVMRVPAGRLRPAGYNPRTITDVAMAGLKSSVKEFGLPQPIVWNRRTGRVVGGHQRLKTMSAKDSTDVVVVDLDAIKEKALNLALNNPHTSGDWTSGLADILSELETEIPDLSTNLRLSELFVDVPTDIDDLLDETESSGTETKGAEPGVEEEESGFENSDIKQIILVVSASEHKEVMDSVKSITKQHGADSTSSAVLWLVREYAG